MTRLAPVLIALSLCSCIGSKEGEVASAGVGVEDEARDIADLCAADNGVVCCDEDNCNCYGNRQRCLDEGNRIWEGGHWTGGAADQGAQAEPEPEPEPQPDPNACASYDWEAWCVDDDDWCDEGDGCCEGDSDNSDGGPCDGGYGSEAGDDTWCECDASYSCEDCWCEPAEDCAYPE